MVKKAECDMPPPKRNSTWTSCLSLCWRIIMSFLTADHGVSEYGFHTKANRGLAGALEVIGNWVFFFASQKTLHPSFQSYFVKQDSTQSWLMTECLEHPALKVGLCSPWRWGISMWFTVKFWFFVGNGCLAAGGARNSGAPETPRGGHCQRSQREDLLRIFCRNVCKTNFFLKGPELFSTEAWLLEGPPTLSIYLPGK